MKVIHKLEDIEPGLDLAIIHGNDLLASKIRVKYPKIKLLVMGKQVNDEYATRIAETRMGIKRKENQVKPRGRKPKIQ